MVKIIILTAARTARMGVPAVAAVKATVPPPEMPPLIPPVPPRKPNDPGGKGSPLVLDLGGQGVDLYAMGDYGTSTCGGLARRC